MIITARLLQGFSFVIVEFVSFVWLEHMKGVIRECVTQFTIKLRRIITTMLICKNYFFSGKTMPWAELSVAVRMILF